MFKTIDENLLLFSSKFAKQKEYWENKLPGDLIKTFLLLKDRQSDNLPGKKKERIEIHIPHPLVLQIEHLSKNSMLSIYMVLLTALKVLIGKYINNRESIIISPVYIPKVSNDTLNKCVFIRDCIDENMTFKELLLKVRQSTMEAYENQDYPFDKSIGHLFHGERKPDHRMISNIGCILENIHDKTVFEDLEEILVFSFRKDDHWLYGNISYDPALYEKVYLEQMGRHFVKILENAIENIDRGLCSIALLSTEDKHRLLFEFNTGSSQYQPGSSIHRLFKEQVLRAPDHIAVISMAPGAGGAVRDEGQEFPIYITYRELYKRSLQLAQQLREKGVGPDTIVALSVGRTVEMIIAIIGILKAGGAYMPMDPEYPEERKQFMLKDSGAKILLTADEIASLSLENVFTQEAFLNPSEAGKRQSRSKCNIFGQTRRPAPTRACRGDSLWSPVSTHHSSNLAYVIYTSGTTGKPKGVMLEHHSVVNLVSGLDERIYSRYKKGLAIALLSPYVFDASVKQVFAALLLGHRLYIATTAARTDAFALVRFYQKYQVEVSDGTPTHLRLLNEVINENRESGEIPVKHFIIGGEELSRPIVENFFKGLRKWSGYPGKCDFPTITNVYGPTECCVDTASYEVGKKTIRLLDHIPLGRPMPNYRVYILGREKELLPIGVPGELCIAGTGTARGYLNNPMLTHDKFINNPFGGTGKIYCSGDTARWMSDGNIAFLGRLDQQVKIRGIRIELQEIESLLFKHEMVKEAVVAAREEVEGDKYLCAYIVPNIHCRGSLDKHELEEYLSGVLPDYMIPSYFMEIDSIPLSPNGKINRKKLPMPGKKSGSNYAAPRDEIEKKLLEIWTGVLEGNDPGTIGIDDNFFHLGGHSLKATILAAKIHKAFDVKLRLEQIFKTPTIRELAGYIRLEPGENKFVSLEPAEKKEYYILSSAQKRLYILHQLEMGHRVYNIPAIVTLKGTLDRKKFEQIFRELIERHESLRTSFSVIDKEPVQRIHYSVEFAIEYYDLIEENHLAARTIENFIRPFDLTHAPLLRIGLAKLEEQVHLLMVDMHHIISDGISVKIFIRDFMELHQEKELTPLKFHYKDYTQWQKREKETGAMQEQAAYWLERFQAEIPVLELPMDFARTGVQGFAGSKISIQMSHEETKRLKELALEQETTLYVILLSVFNVFLSKITNQENIVLGTVVAGRRHTDLESIIGMFVNTLALRDFPHGKKPFTQFLAEIKENTVKAFENQDYPFEELVEKTGVNRDAGRNPLFDVMFTMQDLEIDTIRVPGLKLEPYEYATETSKFDLMFQALDKKENLCIIIEYCTQLFKEATIQRFISYFKKITAVIIENPGIKLGEIEIIPENEKNQILFQFNATVSEYPKDKQIQRLFEEEVEKTPHQAALAYNFQILTYEALDQLADRLAGHFRDSGLEPEAPVGIMLETSLEMIAAVLAALKAGGAYLPIDPGYPGERIDLMLRESNAQLLVTTRSCAACTAKNLGENLVNSGKDILYLEDFQVKSGRESDAHLPFTFDAKLAYIIYTSGSAGRPKGVMVEHRNVIRLVKNTNFIDFKPGDRILQTGALEFDASTFEIWGALLNGLTLYLADKNEILTPGTLKKIITNNQITTMWLTSPFFNQLVQSEERIFAGLRNLLVGGDVLSPPHINQVRKRFRQLHIINGYGPTENTTFSTTFLIDREYQASIPIGKPIANSTAYIVDKDERLQPIGIAGELYVGGDGISRGYLNKPELTAEKFDQDLWDYRDYQDEEKEVEKIRSLDVKKTKKTYKQKNNKKFLPGVQGGGFFKKSPPGRRRQKIYKTGDLAYWLSCGSIEFLGRIDQQVKIRGFRIEPGEIENHILKYSQVREAVVQVRKDEKGDKYLCAYIVSPQGLDSSGLRDFLSGRLPGYMIPSYFVRLEKLPLTSNGKVDWRVLPEPGLEVAAGEGEYLAPRDDIEKTLAQLWSDVLGIETNVISIDADFFTLGGHSLKATILASKIHKAFDVKLQLAQIFETPTIRELSGYIRVNPVENKFSSLEPGEKKEFYALSSAQKRLYILHQLEMESCVYNIPGVMTLNGTLNREKFERIFRKLIERHESLRTFFQIVNEKAVQRIHDKVDFEIEYRDLQSGAQSQSTSIEDSVNSFVRAFDLAAAPLLRVGLIRQDRQKQILMIDMHHIITDGTSMGIFINEFVALYGGEVLPMLRIHYKDFSQWHNKRLEAEEVKTQEEYWLNRFKGEIPVLSLPTAGSGSPETIFKGESIGFKIGKELVDKIRRFILEKETTLFMVLLAFFNILLSKYTGQQDIVVGTPITGRNHADLQNVIGMFVNMLPMRNLPHHDKKFREFLDEVKENALKAYENQDYQFDDLVTKLELTRKFDKNPLFNVVFGLHNEIQQENNREEIEIPGLKLNLQKNTRHMSMFDLFLGAVETENGISFEFHCRSQWFPEGMIIRMSRHLVNIITAAINNPETRILDIEMLNREEKNRLMKKIKTGSNTLTRNKVASKQRVSGDLHASFDF